MTKYILGEAMNGIVPRKIRLRRDKIGFNTPEEELFREPVWQSVVKELLDNETIKNHGFINVQIARILYQKHLSGDVNISREIWEWIYLELGSENLLIKRLR